MKTVLSPRHRLALSPLVLLSLVLASCGGQTPSITPTPGPTETSRPSDDAEDKTLVIGVTSTPPTLDREFGIQEEMWELNYNVAESLLEFEIVDDPENPGARRQDFSGLQGRLAETWEVADDGMSVTFHLRKGVLSYFGNELTAEDVKYTWDRAFDLGAIGPFWASLLFIEGPDDIEIVDDYTVTFRANRPSPMLASVFHMNSYMYIWDSEELSSHATDDDPWATEWAATNSASFGPYQIVEWTPGQQIVLVANPNYYRGEPEIKRVIWQVVPESANRLAVLQAGDVDVVEQLLPRELEIAAATEGIQIISNASQTTDFLTMNTEIPPFDDVRFRQAVSYAIDRDAILDSVYQGFAKPLHAPYASIYPGYTDEHDPYSYDPERARELLSQTPYADGVDVELVVAEHWPASIEVAQFVKSNLEAVGIGVEIVQVTPAVHTEKMTAREFAFFFRSDGPIHPDPIYWLFLHYHCDAFGNFGNYCNTEVSDLITEGQTTLDDDARYAIARDQIVPLIMEEAPMVYLAQPSRVWAARDYVTGFVWHTSQNMTWFDMDVQR